MGKNFDFREKNLTVPKKTERGDPYGKLRGKQEKPFWFSSVDQIVQFGAIIFSRTFKNYFDQFVWIEKSHYNSRVSLHEAPTKNDRAHRNYKLYMPMLQNLFWKLVKSMKMINDL